MQTSSTLTPDWPVIRAGLIQRILGNIPKRKQDRMDVVDAILEHCPNCTWLEAGLWMNDDDGPTLDQRVALWGWLQHPRGGTTVAQKTADADHPRPPAAFEGEQELVFSRRLQDPMFSP